MSEWEGRAVIVTGAANGIGAAVATAFHEKGACVLLLDRDGEAAKAHADRLGKGARALALDVTDRAAMDAVFAGFAQQAGRLDVLVNNAGIGRSYTVENMQPASWDEVIGVNLTGPYNGTRAAIQPMRDTGGGAIVNIASIAGKRMSYLGGADYTASKSGLLGFTRHAAYELAGDGIRVNAVCPGPVLTPLTIGSTTEAERDRTAEMVPLGRWVQPEDIASAVVFLAGPGASMCTGTSLDVDGGVLVSNGVSYRDYFARRGGAP